MNNSPYTPTPAPPSMSSDAPAMQTVLQADVAALESAKQTWSSG